jgi:PHS family inorganic phosphate transporter-like MFS transporter
LFQQGLGIGGDYPMSAVISSEFAATSFRGRLMTATFATQGFGTFSALFVSLEFSFFHRAYDVPSKSAAALVSIIVVSAYKESILDDQAQVDYCWRLLIGLGCVPAVIALLFRLTISETPRFTMDVERNMRRAAEDIEEIVRAKELVADDELVNRRVDVPKASWADFKAHFGQWKNMKVLIGTSWSWFAQDVSHCLFVTSLSIFFLRSQHSSLQVAFYGLGLNTSIFVQAIGFGNLTPSGTQRVYDNLMNVSKGNLIFALAGLIPGYWVSFIFIDKWGRKPIQLMGFIMLTILFVIMGT